MDVIGHRGGAALGPENTLAAIEAGLAAGADGVEVDIRMTADGALVLMHDPDVDRTTNGTGRIDDSTLEQIRALDAGYRFSLDAAHPYRGAGIIVPTLEEVLERVPPERLMVIEVRGHPWEAGHDPSEPVAHAAAALLSETEKCRVVVSSFNPIALQVVREAAPGVRTAVLTHPAFDLGSNLGAAVSGGHDECHVPASLLDAAFVSEAHAAAKRVVAWTVQDQDVLRGFALWGVDGVISDDPRAAQEALRRSD